MERREHPVGEVLIIPMRSSTSLSPQDSARPQTLPLQPSSSPPPASPPPPPSLSSNQLQAEFLRRAPRAASLDNDSDRQQNVPHQPSPPVSLSVAPFSSHPPPLSMSSPQLQAEFLRRVPKAASLDNDSDRHQNVPHQPSPPVSLSVPPFSSPPPPLSMSSPQLQAEFLRRAPRAASLKNDSARQQNVPHQPSPPVSLSVPPFSSPPPPLSMSSPQLQAEFLRRATRGLRTVSCDTNDVLTSRCSTLVSPFTSTTTTSSLTSPPQPLSPSMPAKEGCATLLSLSSPELLTELCQSQSRPMKHVSVSKGLTTVFSGRGRGITTPSTASGAAKQTLCSDSTANGRRQAGPRLSNGTKR